MRTILSLRASSGPHTLHRKNGHRGLLALLIVSSIALSGCTTDNTERLPDSSPIGATEDPESTPDLPYRILPYREPRDESQNWSAPSWDVGDTWRYDIFWNGWQDECKAPDPVTPRTEDEVVGTGPRSGYEIYRVRINSWDCTGKLGGYQDYDYLQTHLVPMDEQGNWVPKLVFPLEDGKRWAFNTPKGDNVTAESTWVPRYEHDGTTISAWRVDLHYGRDDIAHEILVYGRVAKNLVKQEIHRDINGDGARILHLEKMLTSYNDT